MSLRPLFVQINTPNIDDLVGASQIWANKSYLILSDWDHSCSTDAKIS